MRILYSHRILSRDGMGVHLEELVAASRGAGHEVLAVGPHAFESTGFGGKSRVVGAIRRSWPRSMGEIGEILYNIPAFWTWQKNAARVVGAVSADLAERAANAAEAGVGLERR